MGGEKKHSYGQLGKLKRAEDGRNRAWERPVKQKKGTKKEEGRGNEP